MGRLTKENKQQLQFLKSEISDYKHGIIELEKRIRIISNKEADKLSTIIWKLEEYQNH